MIVIKNSQRKIKVNLKKVENAAKQMLLAIKYDDFDLGIWFTTNKTIHHYNKVYRHKDKPTDILSFPYHPGPTSRRLKASDFAPAVAKGYGGHSKASTDMMAVKKPGERIQALTPEDKNLGDLIISLEYVKKSALELNKSFEEHLTMLLAHGIAHLLGYDHETDAEFAVMQKMEKKLLQAVK